MLITLSHYPILFALTMRPSLVKSDFDWTSNFKLIINGMDNYAFLCVFNLEVNMCNALDDIEKAETAQLIIRCLECLPTDQRLIIQLRFYEGLLFHEIAVIMHISETDVYSDYEKAITFLRSKLEYLWRDINTNAAVLLSLRGECMVDTVSPK